MMTLAARTRVTVLTVLLGAWATLGYACNTDDENPATSRNRDAGTSADTGTGTDQDGAVATGAPICDKYGGYDQVKTLAQNILTRAEGDCRISGGFANLNGNTQHLTECFQIQLGTGFQCAGISYVANTTTDSKGQKCRDMSRAHQGLHLRKADFLAFQDDVIAELTAKGLTQDELKSMAAFFVGYQSQVVQEASQPNANTYCPYDGTCATCSPPDGGTDASDASDASDAADADDSG
jgi:hypothetical protein